MRKILGLLLFASAMAVPAHALPPQDAAAKASATIPFKPPLGTVLRFRVTVTFFNGDKPRGSSTHIEALRFVPKGDSFVLYWQVESDWAARAVAAGDANKPTPLEEPIAFDLDSDGAVLRVRDWERVKERLAAPVTGAPTARKLKAAMLQDFSAEDAPGLLLDSFGTVLGWGNFEAELGRPHSEPEEMPLPSLDIVAKTTRTITVTAIDTGKTATVTDETRFDTETTREIVEAVLARMDDPVKEEAVRRRFRENDGDGVTMAGRTTFDLATGLPISHKSKRSAGLNDGAYYILEVEWLR